MGAVPLSNERTAEALAPFKRFVSDLELLTAPGRMGEQVARRCGFDPRVIPDCISPGEVTGPEDTRRAASAMLEAGVDLLLFAGGDGTARDIYTAVGDSVPVLGIPAGVKIHSAVFGITPRSTGELALEFLQGRRIHLHEAEVIDLDEDLYRQGQIVTRLYGYLKIPYRGAFVQNQKVPTPDSEVVQARAIAADVIERMQADRAYLLGPGTTTRAVAESLGIPTCTCGVSGAGKTLIGVDIFTKDSLLTVDVNEKQILEMLDRRPLGIILSPTGGQGFLLGRGNQQISPEVILRVGRENILVICLASKIAALQGRPLLVDTGDPTVDRLLEGYIQVITGYHERIIYKVISP
jgi:predicted polyphosphate/ATP-dependent NAD kinase